MHGAQRPASRALVRRHRQPSSVRSRAALHSPIGVSSAFRSGSGAHLRSHPSGTSQIHFSAVRARVSLPRSSRGTSGLESAIASSSRPPCAFGRPVRLHSSSPFQFEAPSVHRVWRLVASSSRGHRVTVASLRPVVGGSESRRLTTRCSGLATLAAELDIVRRRMMHACVVASRQRSSALQFRGSLWPSVVPVALLRRGSLATWRPRLTLAARRSGR